MFYNMWMSYISFSFSQRDAIDVDNFSKYKRMAKKVIEEKPSKFSIYINLDDVKTGATRVHLDSYVSNSLSHIYIV